MNKIVIILLASMVLVGNVSAETQQAVSSIDSSSDLYCSCKNNRGQASAALCPKGKSLGCMLKPADSPPGWCVAECYNEKNEREIGKKIPCPFNNGEGDCSIIGGKEALATSEQKSDF